LAAAGGGVFLNDVCAGDVGGHQVGRELDAVELELEHLGQRLDQQGLRQTRHPDDETVAADKERLQHQLDDVGLADDALAELGDDLLAADLHLVGKGDVVGRLEIYDGRFAHRRVLLSIGFRRGLCT
jgi:hypothetical protein